MTGEISHTSFGIGSRSFDEELEKLRTGVKNELLYYPMSDPSRVLLSGIAVSWDKIDELRVPTFPAILYQELPMHMDRANQGRILAKPSAALAQSRCGL